MDYLKLKLRVYAMTGKSKSREAEFTLTIRREGFSICYSTCSHKGNYFSLAGKSPFAHLIYPIPEPGGLGVHLTLDMGGQAKLGPDVEWLDIDCEEQIDYTVNPKRGEDFYEAVRRYWPELKDGALQPDYSGVRAKIVPSTAPAGDFCFNGPETHGLHGLYNLYGFESPGLTSSLAIAKHLEGQIKSSL